MANRTRQYGAVSALLLVLFPLLAGCGPATPSATSLSPTARVSAPTTMAASATPVALTPIPTSTLRPTVPWPTLPQAAIWEGVFVSSLAWFPDGKLLAVTTSSGVLLADGRTLDQVGALLRGVPVAAVDIAPDGLRFALAVIDTVQLWSPAGQEWQRESVLRGGGGKVFSVAFSPDGALLAAGEVSGTVRVWSVQTGEQVQVWSAHQGETFDVAFSPDGTLLATAGRDGFVRLWRVPAWEPAGAFRHADAVRGIAFSPDRRLLAAASYDGTVGVWDLASGQEVRALRGHIAQVNCVAFSPDGGLLASGGMDGSVRVWDVSKGETVGWAEDHIDPVSAVAFSPDGRFVASGGWDGTARLWSLEILPLLAPGF